MLLVFLSQAGKVTPWASLVDDRPPLLGSSVNRAHVFYPGAAGCLEWESGRLDWVGELCGYGTARGPCLVR